MDVICSTAFFCACTWINLKQNAAEATKMVKFAWNENAVNYETVRKLFGEDLAKRMKFLYVRPSSEKVSQDAIFNLSHENERCTLQHSPDISSSNDRLFRSMHSYLAVQQVAETKILLPRDLS